MVDQSTTPDHIREGLAELTHDSLRGVDHVAIAVRDIDRSLEYFRDRLGLVVVHDETLGAPPVRLLFLDAGNVRIQLVQPLGPGRVATFLQERGEGLHHVCFRVGSIEETVDSLGLVRDGEIFTGAAGQPSCFLDDGESGAVIELTESAPRTLPR